MASRTKKAEESVEEPAAQFAKEWTTIGGLRVRRKVDGRTQIQTLNGAPSVSLSAEEFAELSAF